MLFLTNPESSKLQTIQVRHENKLIRDVLWTLPHGHTSIGWPFAGQLDMDTGCCLENLLRVMTDRNRWKEGVIGISSVGTPW